MPVSPGASTPATSGRRRRPSSLFDIITAAIPLAEIQYHILDRVATITLNRPDKLNAWTALMEQEVRQAMYAAEADDQVRVIVLTGAGRGFCAGADMALLNSIAQSGLGWNDAGHALRNSDNGASRTHVPADFQKKYSYF